MNNLMKSYNLSKNNYPIDYVKIGEAIKYYQKKGFTYIDVPWDTPKKYREVTFSGVDFEPIDGDRYIVGSAEQSFIYLNDVGVLDKGSYVACTPCLRGDEVDDTHQQYFMKVELFDSNDTSEKRLMHIIRLAKEFFEKYIPVRIIQTGNLQFDIETNFGLELGSYGINMFNNKKWVYATGLAEPRLSKSLLKIH